MEAESFHKESNHSLVAQKLSFQKERILGTIICSVVCLFSEDFLFSFRQRNSQQYYQHVCLQKFVCTMYIYIYLLTMDLPSISTCWHILIYTETYIYISSLFITHPFNFSHKLYPIQHPRHRQPILLVTLWSQWQVAGSTKPMEKVKKTYTCLDIWDIFAGWRWQKNVLHFFKRYLDVYIL